MNITQPYKYPILERETQPTGERCYITPTGPLPSVTTILSATSNNPGLDAWREYVGEIKAEKVRNEATGLGSLMHDHLEKYALGVERPGGSNLVRAMARNMADAIITHGLSRVDEIWGIEAPLYYPDQYAGTADLICRYDGRMMLGDYKTTNKMKTRDQIGDYKCQLAAYAEAHNILYGTNINAGVIFMASRACEFQAFIFEGKEWDDAIIEWWERVIKFQNI